MSTVNPISIPYPNFQNGDLIDPEQFDANFNEIQNKINEIVDEKTDLNGNHQGTWQGLSPGDLDVATQAEDIAQLQTDVVSLQNNKYDKTGGTISGAVSITGLTNIDALTTITRTGNNLKLKGTLNGIQNTVHLDFHDGLDARQGFIGYDTTANFHLYHFNYVGDIVLSTALGKIHVQDELQVDGVLTTNNDIITSKSSAGAQISATSTTDDSRIKLVTTATENALQSGNGTGATAKNLDIEGTNGGSIPVLTLRGTSTVATGAFGVTGNTTLTGTFTANGLSTFNAGVSINNVLSVSSNLTVGGTISEGGSLLSNKYMQSQATAWVNLSLSNGWTNVGAPFPSLSYRKNAIGEVEIRGVLVPGTITIDTTIATLPVGFRPTHQRRYVLAQASGTSPQSYGGAVQIESTGIIKVLLSHATNHMSFDNIPPIAVD